MKTFEYKSEKELPTQLEQVGTAMNVLQMGFTNYLGFAYGIVWFVPFLLVCGLITILLERKEESSLILLGFVSFAPIYYLSLRGRAEDTARYLLLLTSLIGLTCGIYLEKIYGIIKKYYKQLALIIFVFVIFLCFLNLNEKLTTMKQVKQFSSAFFDACNFVKRNVSENALLMTVWIHQSSYNCQRNIAPFGLPDSGDIVLSENLTLALSRLKAHGITHIFIQKFSISSTPAGEKYPISFIQFLENNPNTFVKIYENGPSLQQCLQAGGCDGNILYEINYTKF
jgi:hypothetical protein